MRSRPWAEVTLAHLFKELPVVGGVQVTLTEDPYVAYGVNIKAGTRVCLFTHPTYSLDLRLN